MEDCGERPRRAQISHAPTTAMEVPSGPRLARLAEHLLGARPPPPAPAPVADAADPIAAWRAGGLNGDN